jgi:hypothetical protein
MSPATCQKRIEALESQLDALIAEEHTLVDRRADFGASEPGDRGCVGQESRRASSERIQLGSAKPSSASSSRSCG